MVCAPRVERVCERVGGTDERVPPTMAEMLANALHEQALEAHFRGSPITGT
jgi:hypothetical protein